MARESNWSRTMRNGDHNLWKGVAAGAAGGLVAAWVMSQFQTGWGKVAEKLQHSKTPQGEQERRAEADSEDATMKTAGKISESVFHRELSRDQKKKLGPVVHYAFGATTGALYGGIAEVTPKATFGAGMPYGTAVFLGADELAVPALGLSKPPKEYPASTHLYGLASHLLYGASLELVRRGVRRLMD
jgi:putative membrane protein